MPGFLKVVKIIANTSQQITISQSVNELLYFGIQNKIIQNVKFLTISESLSSEKVTSWLALIF